MRDKIILDWATEAQLSVDAYNSKKDAKNKDEGQIDSSAKNDDDYYGSEAESDFDQDLDVIGVENRTKFLEKMAKLIEFLKQEDSDDSSSDSSSSGSSSDDNDKKKKD